MQALEDKSRGAWRPSPGAVYPALAQLEDEKLVRGEEIEGGGGRVFTLTSAGQKAAAANKDAGIGAELPSDDADDARMELLAMMKDFWPAALAVAHSGSPAQLAEAKQVLKNAKKALYRILAEDDDDE
jgi:DNA-binding PadR family transcriptional regulator